jgi:flagellar hook assembly protein FlgD
VGVEGGPRPGALRLHPAAPNPFRNSTRAGFDLPRAGNVKANVYDLSGRRVRQLADGFQPAGSRSLSWNGLDDEGRRVRPGMYVLSLQADRARETRRLVLLK